MISEVQTSFRGGMNHSASMPGNMKADEAHLIENGFVDRDGAVRMRSRYAYHSIAINGGTAGSFTGAEVWGAYEYSGGALGAAQIIRVVGQTIQRSPTTAIVWTNIATGLTEHPWVFDSMEVAGVAYMLACNGAALYSYDGTTWAAVATCPIAPHFLAVFNNRLYVGRTDDPTIYGSKIADFATWATPDGVELPIGTNDGESASGLLSLGTMLLAFKKNSTNYIDGFGNSDIVVAAGARGVSGSVGCVAYRTAKRCGDYGAMWLSARGVEYYAPGGEITLISKPIDRKLVQLQWDKMVGSPATGLTAGSGPCATYWGDRNEYIVAVPDDTATPYEHDRMYHFSLTFNCWYTTSFNAGWTRVTSIATYGGSTTRPILMIGGNGTTSHFETAENNGFADSGTNPYQFELKARLVDFGHPTITKRVRQLRITAEPVQTSLDLSVSYVRDPGRVDANLENDGVASTPVSVTFDATVSLTPVTALVRKNQRCRTGYARITFTSATAKRPSIMSIEQSAELYDRSR